MRGLGDARWLWLWKVFFCKISEDLTFLIFLVDSKFHLASSKCISVSMAILTNIFYFAQVLVSVYDSLTSCQFFSHPNQFSVMQV